MATLNLRQLITHLEILEENLNALWSACKNYDLLFQIDEMRCHVGKILDTLRYVDVHSTT